MALRTISVQLAAKLGSYVTNMREAGQATRQLGTELQGLSQSSKQQFGTITDQARNFGLVLTGAFVGVIASAASFDKQMSEVQAVSGASGKTLDALRTAAISAGQATVFSASQAAQAEAELAKAGLSAGEILGGGLTGAMALASAGSLGLADAATYTATALNEFQLNGLQASHVADLLSAGANESATDVKGLADSLNQAGLISHNAGLSIEDTVGVLAAFAQAGLHGSDAGTSLKTMLQALNTNSPQTVEMMRQLGITAYDAGGKFIGITALAQQLQNRLKGLTEAQRQAAFAQIFGTDATRAAEVLYQSGAAGIQEWITKVNQTGAAADTARTKMNNLSGDVENLKGSIETLTISSGEGAQSGLRSLTQPATRAVNSIGVMPASVSKYGTALVGLIGVSALGAVGLAKLRAKSAEVQESLQAMGPSGVKAANGLQTATTFASRLTITLGLLQTVSAAFGSSVNTPVTETVKSLDLLGSTGKATGADLQHLNYDLGTLGSGGMAKFGNGVSGVIEGLSGTGNLFDESLTHAKERIADWDQALSQMVSSGDIPQATAAFKVLSDAADQQGISLSDLKAGLPNYVAAMDSYTESQKKGAAGTDALSTAQANNAANAASQAVQQQKVANSIADTIGQTKGLTDLLDRLSGKNQSVIQTEDQLHAAYDAATASIKKNGKTAKDNRTILDDTTAKGRANRESLLGIAQAADAASQATLDQTGSAKKANAVLEQAHTLLVKDGIAMGLSKDAAQKYADQLLKIPPTADTSVSTPGLPNAWQQLEPYVNAWQTLQAHPFLNQTILTHFQTAKLPKSGVYAHGNRWGGVYTHAATGLLSDAQVYSPLNPGRYMIAEPQTGGEAFVPKYGNYQRSTSIIDTAARWYGGRFVGNAGGAGWGGSHSTYAPSITNNIYPQRADWTPQDYMAMQARTETMLRVGRPR